jgi:formylglycine-generating enzyme required for sulfatase activity
MIGNVSEWCRDIYGEYTLSMLPATGERHVTNGSEMVYRGSNSMDSAEYARATVRTKTNPRSQNPLIGVRPARQVDN